MNALNYASLCVRCGKCLNTCPTYSVLPFETSSPRGRLGLIDAITTKRINYRHALESLSSCMLCARCEKVCELKIPLTKIIVEMRHKMSVSSTPDFTESAIRLLFGAPEGQRKNLKFLAKILNALPKGYVGGLLYRLLRLDSRAKVLQELKVKTFLELFKQERNSEVALFIGCAVNYLFHDIGASAISMFKKIEMPLDIPASQNCCGLVLWAIGDKSGAKRLAEKNLKVFKNYKKIIFICRSCSYAFKKLYPELLGESKENLKALLLDATEIFSENSKKLEFTCSENEAELHVACHAELTDSELDFLKLLKISAADSSCCGGGGSFGLKFSSMSKRMAENRLAKASRPSILTDCLGCHIQLKYLHIDKKVKVTHLLKWLDEKTVPKKGI